MEMLSGVRRNAMWPSRGRAVDGDTAVRNLLAGGVNIIHLEGDMAEIAPAGVLFRVPVIGQLKHRRRLGRPFHPFHVAGRRQEHQGVKRPLSLSMRFTSRIPMTSQKKDMVSSRSETRSMVCRYRIGYLLFRGLFVYFSMKFPALTSSHIAQTVI